MQSLEQEIDPLEQSLTSHDHPVLRGLMADQAAAHAEEVRLLRQRIATLEAALASAKASPMVENPANRVAPLFATDAPLCRTEFAGSEFSEPVAPAVVAMPRDMAVAASPTGPTEAAATSAAATSAAATTAVPAQTEPPPAEAFADQGFADAWGDNAESSFEERIAQKAFFQVGSVDEESRNWLLTS